MSSDYWEPPIRSVNNRRVTTPSPVDFASVEYSVSYTCIAEAWKKVRSNKGAPGVDNISIEAYPKWVRPKCKDIKQQLLEGSYKPTPVLRVEIPKESGGVPQARHPLCVRSSDYAVHRKSTR